MVCPAAEKLEIQAATMVKTASILALIVGSSAILKVPFDRLKRFTMQDFIQAKNSNNRPYIIYQRTDESPIIRYKQNDLRALKNNSSGTTIAAKDLLVKTTSRQHASSSKPTPKPQHSAVGSYRKEF